MNDFELKTLQNEIQKIGNGSIKIFKTNVITELRATVKYTYLKEKYYLDINVITNEKKIILTKLINYIERKIEAEKTEIDMVILSKGMKYKEDQLIKPVFIRLLTFAEKQARAYCRFNKIDYAKTSVRNGYISNKMKNYINKGLTKKQALDELIKECDIEEEKTI